MEAMAVAVDGVADPAYEVAMGAESTEDGPAVPAEVEELLEDDLSWEEVVLVPLELRGVHQVLSLPGSPATVVELYVAHGLSWTKGLGFMRTTAYAALYRTLCKFDPELCSGKTYISLTA